MSMSNHVACAVCGKSMSTINNRHLAGHGLTAEEYRRCYPDAPMRSEAATAKKRASAARSNEHRKGRARSPQELAAIREGVARRPSRRGIARGPMSDATKTKLSKGRKAALAAGTIVHPRLGVTLSDETRQRIAQKLTGRSVGPDAALKAVATKRNKGLDLAVFRGRVHSQESKRKIGEGSRLRYAEARETTRQPMLERIAGARLTLINRIDDPIFRLRCDICGYEFTRTPQMFQPSKFHARACDQCFPTAPVSVAETDLSAFVSSLIGPDGRVLRSDVETIPPLELDILVPGRIAIEYCGLYWHSEAAGRGRFYHRTKLDRCRSAGVRLLTVFEDEWLTNRHIVENAIRNALGCNDRRIDARDCEVIELSQEQSSAFIRSNHLQGAGRSSVKYGLIFEGEIVSAMTFSSSEVSRRSTGWDINRFCSLGGTSVRGAAGRLFARFVRDHRPKEVMTYADLRYGTGAVYERLGFQMLGLTTPGYWYFKPNDMRRYHRYALRKRADEPKDRSEWELRRAEGWNRIWDCGHAKWLWKAQ